LPTGRAGTAAFTTDITAAANVAALSHGPSFTNGATPLSDTPTLSNYSAFTHGSRREAAEHYDVSASTAVIWVKCFRETGRCAAKTPMRTFLDAMPMTKEKMIAA
jgi:hypothetical protein